jgi:hypothetical protein
VAVLPPGNVHSAGGWKNLLEPVIDMYKLTGKRIYFRADAAFVRPDVYEHWEENHILYAIRIPAIQNPRVGFIVTNMSAKAKNVVRF